MSKTKQKTAVCPRCKEEYPLQRGSTKKMDSNMYAPVSCTNCGYEFDWSKGGDK